VLVEDKRRIRTAVNKVVKFLVDDPSRFHVDQATDEVLRKAGIPLTNGFAWLYAKEILYQTMGDERVEDRWRALIPDGTRTGNWTHIDCSTEVERTAVERDLGKVEEGIANDRNWIRYYSENVARPDRQVRKSQRTVDFRNMEDEAA
jgi:hypothetical protein